MSENEISGNGLKIIELDILKYIKRCCEENNLQYYLAYGTLLGAVRHQGFIPWDDDIDIWMPRKDYNKFLELEFHNKNAKYKVLSCKNDVQYYYEIAKVVALNTHLEEKGLLPIKDYGVYVDVFPLDGLPKYYKAILFLFKCMGIMKMAAVNIQPAKNLKHKNRAWLFRFIGIVSTLLGARKYAWIVDKLAQKTAPEKSVQLGCLVSGEGKKDIYDGEIFSSVVKLKFEDEYFDAPGGYCQCLSQLYGDYMTLPPENERVSKHIFNAYYKKEV